VRVNGRLDTCYGEREISLVRIDDMAWNRAPIYLPITGATLTVLPPAPATLWEAWLLIR
jgi:hypothetical protein